MPFDVPMFTFRPRREERRWGCGVSWALEEDVRADLENSAIAESMMAERKGVSGSPSFKGTEAIESS